MHMYNAYVPHYIVPCICSYHIILYHAYVPPGAHEAFLHALLVPHILCHAYIPCIYHACNTPGQYNGETAAIQPTQNTAQKASPNISTKTTMQTTLMMVVTALSQSHSLLACVIGPTRNMVLK